MPRTTTLKIAYIVVLVVLVVVAGLTIWAFGGSIIVSLLLAIMFLLPGRIQGFLFRDLFRGRRLIATGDFTQSRMHSQRFLDQINKQPWQKPFLWLSWSIYTIDVEAMALNNIAVAYLEQGEWEEAEAMFLKAVAVDAKYPLPFYNLSLIAELNGSRQQAQKYLSVARDYGFTGLKIDQIITEGQELLARVEGRGYGAP